MASLKCSNCGNGIHYHDEPNGTQYIVFNASVWERIVKSDKSIIRYILDENAEFYLVWLCKKCETLHVFYQDSTKLISAFKPSNAGELDIIRAEKYVAFTDADWELMTEPRTCGKEAEAKGLVHSCISVIQSGDLLTIEVKNVNKNIELSYKKISTV